jgi:phosphatidylethanolamine/phosphatidyl-N-methylethanolamine N-methyltransferase
MRAGAIELDRDMVAKAYDRWAPVYDMVFGPVFERGRKAAIRAAERVGGRILEVGVGTGISLPDYSPRNRIFGVDISEMMLRKARERVTELGLGYATRSRHNGRCRPRPQCAAVHARPGAAYT